jgi:arginyl-tRNA synthetase
VFDPDRMVSLVGNTSVYLQYAYARTASILAKAGFDPRAVPSAFIVGGALDPVERALVLVLDEFEATLQTVVSGYEPHRLCTYLYGLAQRFTAFFERCPVLKAEPAVRARRLALCELTGRTLRTGLDLLGVATPYPI